MVFGFREVFVVGLLALLLGCTGAGQGPAGNGTNETLGSPIHTPAEITGYLQKHLVVYYGLWNVEIPSPEYSKGAWSTDVRVNTDDGGQMILRTAIWDENLTVNEIWQRVFLNGEPAGIANIPGKLSCSEGGKVRVMEFANPYCPNCVLQEKYVFGLKSRFNNSIDYQYGVMLPTTNQMIQEYGFENVSMTSEYYACAQKQSPALLDGLRKCVMGQYAKQNGKPLALNQLDSCAIDNGLNMTELKACIPAANSLLALDEKLGETYLGDYIQLPTFVVDCRFKTTNPNLVRYAICYNFPDTVGC